MAVSALQSFKYSAFTRNRVDEPNDVISTLAVTSEIFMLLLLCGVNTAKNYSKYKHKKL